MKRGTESSPLKPAAENHDTQRQCRTDCGGFCCSGDPRKHGAKDAEDQNQRRQGLHHQHLQKCAARDFVLNRNRRGQIRTKQRNKRHISCIKHAENNARHHGARKQFSDGKRGVRRHKNEHDGGGNQNAKTARSRNHARRQPLGIAILQHWLQRHHTHHSN